MGKKMLNETKNMEEIIRGLPFLKSGFDSLDSSIRYYGRKKREESKQELIEIREELFNLTQNLMMGDLYILYYVRKIKSLGKVKMLRILKKLYRAEQKFEEELCGEWGKDALD